MPNLYANFIGVDISKHKIDVYETKNKKHYANDSATLNKCPRTSKGRPIVKRMLVLLKTTLIH